MTDFEKVIEHSIEAFYAGGPGDPYYQSVMTCSCGYSTGRKECWEYAGVYMDDHLTKVGGGSQTDGC